MEMLSNGILDIDETEGEEISLTAEGPQLTEEERLRIESEKEEGDDEDVKRIDLFTSEDGEADPLNKLLMAEDGISTLFMKKGGRVPLKDGTDKPAIQGGGPNYLGKQPEVKVPKYWKSSPDHPDTELAYITEPEKQVLIALNMHGGLEDGKPNTGPNGIISLQGDMGSVGGSSSGNNGNDNQGSDQGHSRFDVGSGYYGEEVTDKGERGDTTTETVETFYDDEITRKNPIERVYTNYSDRKNKFEKTQRKDALTFMAKTAFFGLNPYSVYSFGKKQNQKKTDYINSVKKDIDTLKELGIPEYNPHTDTLIQTLEQDILDLTQPKDKEEDKNDNDAPVTELIATSTETIEDRDETDIFDVWDRIKSNQAKRAMLVEKDIIQDNEPLPITKESVSSQLLNNGGLANLFRVKTQ
jgi:hypothetical protein